jgi:hypothetical protein
MARTPLVRVPRRSRAHQSSGPNHRLRRWLAVELQRLQPLIAASAAACHAEKYRKHFTSFMHGCVLLFHGLSHGRSLTQSYAAFGACHGLLTLSGLAMTDDPTDERLGVSFSQLAASNTSRPADFLAGLVPVLAERVRALGRASTARVPPDLQLLDGTFVRLSLKLAPWLPNNGSSDVPGVRVQWQYGLADDLPAFLCLTDSHTSDRQAFDRLLDAAEGPLEAWRGQTLVMDLGYYGHRRFARLLHAGVHLVTRLLGQASYVVAGTYPVQAPLPTLPAAPIQIHSDQRIWLGSPLNTAGAVLPNLRLVTATVQPAPKAARQGAKPVVYEVLTDRWDLTALEVVQIYLWRWQIELFFRWLKHHVHLLPPLGYSRAALELTVWVSLIVHLLSVLAAHALGYDRRTPPLLAQILWAFAHLSPTDLVPQEPVGYQLAFGEVPLPCGASP